METANSGEEVHVAECHPRNLASGCDGAQTLGRRGLRSKAIYGRTVTGRPAAPLDSEGVDGLARALSAMHSHVDYQFPLSAAQFQYRSHYYGLSSAGLLEDVFFDAFHHFLQKHEGVKLERPPRGQKEWDYRYRSLEVSHKIQQTVSALAVLWDATVDMPIWSGEQPIVVGLSAPKDLRQVKPDGSGLGQASAVWEPPHLKVTRGVSNWDPAHSQVKRGKSLLLVAWPLGAASAEILYRADASENQQLIDIAPLRAGVWGAVRHYLSREEAHANELDMVTVTTSNLPPDATHVELKAELRAGIYVISTDHLQNLATEVNNRGVLIPKETVAGILHIAAEEGRLIPSPAWFGFYTRNRPPDLFLAQLDEFQRSFSVAPD